MEKRLQDVFDELKMPVDCADRIEQVLERRQEGFVAQPMKQENRWLPAMAAAAAMLVMIFGFGLLTSRMPSLGSEESVPTGGYTAGTTAQATVAAEETEPEVQMPTVDPTKEEEYREVEKLLREGLHYTEGNVTYWYALNNGGMDSGAWYDGMNLHSPFTEYVDGRVYFVANGEYIDITDTFSEEEPFTYIFTDQYYIVHYIAIGGTPESIGYLEMCHKEWDPSLYGGLGGFSANHWSNETQEYYGWWYRAKEIFGQYGVYWA